MRNISIIGRRILKMEDYHHIIYTEASHGMWGRRGFLCRLNKSFMISYRTIGELAGRNCPKCWEVYYDTYNRQSKLANPCSHTDMGDK